MALAKKTLPSFSRQHLSQSPRCHNNIILYLTYHITRQIRKDTFNIRDITQSPQPCSLHSVPQNVFPNFRPTRVSEEPVCMYLFWKNPVLTYLHLRSTFMLYRFRNETLSYVLPESLFTSVSTGRLGPPLSVSLTVILQSKSYEKGLLKYDRYTNTPFYVVFALGSWPSSLVSALDTARSSYYQVRSIDFAYLTIQNIKNLHGAVIFYVRSELSMKFFVATFSRKYLLDKKGSRGSGDNCS